MPAARPIVRTTFSSRSVCRPELRFGHDTQTIPSKTVCSTRLSMRRFRRARSRQKVQQMSTGPPTIRRATATCGGQVRSTSSGSLSRQTRCPSRTPILRISGVPEYPAIDVPPRMPSGRVPSGQRNPKQDPVSRRSQEGVGTAAHDGSTRSEAAVPRFHRASQEGTARSVGAHMANPFARVSTHCDDVRTTQTSQRAMQREVTVRFATVLQRRLRSGHA